MVDNEGAEELHKRLNLCGEHLRQFRLEQHLTLADLQAALQLDYGMYLDVWITDLLEKSLQHAVWVDLHLQERPDVLPNPWSMVVQELDQEPHALPAGTSILQVFDEAEKNC